jgi:hypothetical protein
VAAAVVVWMSNAPAKAPNHLAAAVLGEALLIGAVRGEALCGDGDAPIALCASSLHSDGLTGAADTAPDYPSTPRPASRPLALAIAACRNSAQLHTLHGLCRGIGAAADSFDRGSCRALFNSLPRSTTLTSDGVAAVAGAGTAPDPSDAPSFLELAVLGAGPLTGKLKRGAEVVSALRACGGDLDRVRAALAPAGGGVAASPAEQQREAALLGTALQLLARQRTMAAGCLAIPPPAPAAGASSRAVGKPPKKAAAGAGGAGASGHMAATASARGGAGSRR